MTRHVFESIGNFYIDKYASHDDELYIDFSDGSLLIKLDKDNVSVYVYPLCATDNAADQLKVGRAKLDDSKNLLWENNRVQFSRLLFEIQANVALDQEDWENIGNSMDLSREEILEIFDRATSEFEENKSFTMLKSKDFNLYKDENINIIEQ